MSGAAVRCPLCRTTFQAPEEDAPEVPHRPVARAVPMPDGARDRPPPSEDFHFSVESEETQLGFRHRAALKSASFWLQMTVVIDFIACIFNCCFGITLPSGDPTHAFLALAALGVHVLTLPILAIAALQLPRRRGYGLILTGGILALPLGMLTLLSTAPTALHGIHQFDSSLHHEAPGFVFLAIAALMLGGAVSAIVAGIKTIRVLWDAEIRKWFY
jgi:hypothetical protein